MGEGRPLVLAEGAAMVRPLTRIRAFATGWEGKRTATVSRPPVVSWGMSPEEFTMMVRGPGQKASASFCMSSVYSAAISLSWPSSHMCTIKGLSEGRPLAA